MAQTKVVGVQAECDGILPFSHCLGCDIFGHPEVMSLVALVTLEQHSSMHRPHKDAIDGAATGHWD